MLCPRISFFEIDSRDPSKDFIRLSRVRVPVGKIPVAKRVTKLRLDIEGFHFSGPVQILVSNAGITRDGLLLRMGEDDFASVIDANLTAAYRVCKRATQGMLRARSGRIILMSSVVALMGSAGQANYSASKAGLVGLARSLARELGSRSITVNVVAPGPIDTDMTAALGEKRLEEIASAVPLGRTGTVDEIAGVVTFLASPAAAYITGAVIPVDGGLGMGH